MGPVYNSGAGKAGLKLNGRGGLGFTGFAGWAGGAGREGLDGLLGLPEKIAKILSLMLCCINADCDFPNQN